MALTSKFSINGADTIAGELVVPINWQNAFVNLSFDKDSVIAKSKGVVSTTEWEWISKTAKFLSDYQKDGLTGGFGVLVGVPFQWELTDDNQRQIIFDGYLDLSKSTFECDKVTTSSTEKKQIDDLNSKVDSFTYEYLMSIGKVRTSDYVYVPYAKLPVENLALELVTSIIQLTILIIQLVQAITDLVKHISAITVFSWPDLFKIIAHFVYCIFLITAVSQAIVSIVKLIIQPIKYHAGMTELRLMEVASNYLGYQFASTILEDDFPTAVIIPEKWAIIENPDDNLVTGFTEVDQMINQLNPSSNRTNEQGYYNGTFGDVIRALKIKYNAKVIIEDSTTGGLPILRFERQDYIADASQLYEIPAIDNNDRFTLNADEFKSNYLIEYQLDSANKAGYINYDNTVFQATTSVNNFPERELVLMRGLETKSIPFAKGVRKNELTKVEEVMEPLINTIDQLTASLIVSWNETVLDLFFLSSGLIEKWNVVLFFFGGGTIPAASLPSAASMPLIELPLSLGGDRKGLMQVENDFLNVPHNVVMTNEAPIVDVTAPSAIEQVISNFDLNGQIIDLTPYFLNQNTSGDFLGNKLIENHNEIIGTENLWNAYHSINCFVPNTNGSTTDLSDSKHNQWKLYNFENVPFCMEDYLKVKGNNNITFAGKVGRIESLEWDVYNQTAKISFRVNELWTTNLQINYNGPIGR